MLITVTFVWLFVFLVLFSITVTITSFIFFLVSLACAYSSILFSSKCRAQYSHLRKWFFFRLFVSWTIFLPPSTLPGSFAGYSHLGWQSSLFTLRMLQILLAFEASTEQSAVILMVFLSYVPCVFFSCSFEYSFSVLYTYCFNYGI